MPKVVREDLDNLNAVLNITIEQADYSSKFEEELNKYRKKAQIKGFRAGKTPMTVIRKLYGRPLLADVVNNLLQDSLNDYLQETQLHLLGQPIPNEEQEEINFELKELKDFVFRFDIGLAPEFEVQGLDATNTFEQPVVDVTGEMIEEDLLNLRRRASEPSFPEDHFQAGDLLSFTARELNPDESVKAEGHSAKFSLLLDDASPAARETIQSLNVGDHFIADLFSLEANRDEAFVRRYMLHLEPEDNRDLGRRFELTIEKAERHSPADLDQEFFDKAFGPGQVHNEEELRSRISSGISGYYQAQSDALLFRQFQDRLMEMNPLPLPDAFLRRWIKASNEEASEQLLEKEYPLFAKNLQWTLIRNKIVRQFQLEVNEQAILDHFKNQVRGYFGHNTASIGEDFISSMAARLMQDEKQVENVYDQLLTDLLHDAIRSVVTVIPQVVSADALTALAEQARAEASANRQTLVPENEEE